MTNYLPLLGKGLSNLTVANVDNFIIIKDDIHQIMWKREIF